MTSNEKNTVDFGVFPAEKLTKIQTEAENIKKKSPLSTLPLHIIAVSKGQPADKIESLLIAGHREFGENRVQEAQEKWPALKVRYPDVRLHMIGSLQSNKVKEACELFDVIHTVDRESLIDALAREKNTNTKTLQYFLQINTGAEEQKGGVAPAQAKALLDYSQGKITISGLMCIPPAEENPALHFAFLQNLSTQLELRELSMGMSGDFETAIRFGATYIRIGTAIFGERA